MARVKWDQIAEKFFEGGCSKGMCYTGYNATTSRYDAGQAWNGISGFTDNPSGADEQKSYADNIKYISMRGAENYGFNVKCFWYPENFLGCLGKKAVTSGVNVSQQKRETFGFCVTTQVGNDVDGTEAGETLHIIWNATTSPSSKDYSSLNESPSPSELSFEASANPVAVGGDYKPTCNIEISTVGKKDDADFMAVYNQLCDTLYGVDEDYNLLTETTAPTDWPAIAQGATKSTKYFKVDGEGFYVGVESTDSYVKDTFYLKINEKTPQLPTPAAVIDMFASLSEG